MDPVKFGIVGIGGFGSSHVRQVEALEQTGSARLDAAVVIDPENHPDKLAEFETRKVRVYDTFEDLLDAGGVDYITLPIGIHFHVPFSIAALEAGFNVYCEKPMTATIQDANRLIETKNRTGKTVLIGYQSVYTPSIQTIKTRLFDGRLGKLNAIRIKGGWPRNDAYYNRNGWAGNLTLDDGTYVLDSPINNAMAHDLNNAMFLCGASHHESAIPKTVQAELYRARDYIQTFDTAILRAKANDIDVIIGLSHSTQENFGPLMQLQCENGTVEWSRATSTIRYNDGTEEPFDDGNNDRGGPFRNAVEVIKNNATPLCPPEVAVAQTLLVNGAHESCPEIVNHPADQIQVVDRNDSIFHVVNDMDDLLDQSFREGKLFSELGVDWAASTQPFDLTNYSHYPSS